MKTKKFLAIFAIALMVLTLVACGPEGTKTAQSGTDGTDKSSLKGTTIKVYTHMGNRVLGEEKKDEAGNTYRDVENTAFLKYLAEDFTKETGINVELNVVTNEEELRPLFQVKDDSIDVYTCPNWSLEEWAAYAEPYCTVEEGIELYGEYAKAMPIDDMPPGFYSIIAVYGDLRSKIFYMKILPGQNACQIVLI
jgi:raffinose/stachyose/melibiose transport system substrate-binding protein